MFVFLIARRSIFKLATWALVDRIICLSQNMFLELDSEYPEWLFTMNVKRPKPSLDEMVSFCFLKFVI